MVLTFGSLLCIRTYGGSAVFILEREKISHFLALLLVVQILFKFMHASYEATHFVLLGYGQLR